MDKFIQKIAKEAGDAVLKRFGKDKEWFRKSEHRMDMVTKADYLADKIITTAIKKRYPSHGIISEESGVHNPDATYVWTVDPIDGTLNFASGIPLFGVMIALVREKEVLIAAVYMPATQEFFFAKAGRGAYMNGKRITCSRTRELSKSAGYGISTLRPRTRKFLRNLVSSIKGDQAIIGSLSSCANECYVAAGRRDWVVFLSGKIWDFTPVYLLLKEAGCRVTDTKGRPWKFGTLEMVAANPVLHKQLIKLTKGL